LLGWFLHKFFGTIYEREVIDKAALTKIQAHSELTEGPLIIIPTHRSYIDFLIMSYVLFGNKIKCPQIAAAEDFLNMAVIHIILRRSGHSSLREIKKYRQLRVSIFPD
jgi:glycerone phosphate O-acyltransferase/fatty acyl-CoA reductase